jgi:MSHA biogenesis protein MshM
MERYIVKELESVRMGINTFNEGAIELIIRSDQGNLRLCRQIFAPAKSTFITSL